MIYYMHPLSLLSLFSLLHSQCDHNVPSCLHLNLISTIEKYGKSNLKSHHDQLSVFNLRGKNTTYLGHGG